MSKAKNLIDCEGRTIQFVRDGYAPLACTRDRNRVKTIGRLYHSSRRWSWAVRYELRNDLTEKKFDCGARFVPVEQA